MTKFITPVFYKDDFDEWGRNFRDDVKNKIRKAQRSSVQIEQSDSLPGELWEQAYARKNIKPPIEVTALAKWCASLIDDSLLKIYTANIDGVPVAFRGELISGEFAYDWLAGSNPDFHATGANQLLMSEIGKRLVESNVKTWDLVGGQVKNVYDFKKSFGAKDAVYYQGERHFNLKGKVFSYLRKIKYGR
ncbi:MAG: GNAT family N-acetyltransferase [candidate division Zixibacteria bacterium]